MTITISNTANTNTFDYWRNRTNQLAHSMSNFVVTTDSNTAVGNAAVSSAFTANVLIANTVRVSNSTSNVVISVPNTVQVSTGDYFLNANGNWSPVISPITTLSTNTSGTSSQEIDNYNMSNFGAVEFFVRVKNNLANGYHATKILTFHNNVDAFSTEYGVMTSNGSLGSFAVSTNATHVILSMTPTSSNTDVTIARVNF
jgi:hypothetical protein